MTPDQAAQLATVNREVNAIPYHALPASDEPYDWWTDDPTPGRSWVCRDYVMLKADRLKALAWAPASLTVILCYTEPVGNPPQREYHAVLGVLDDDGMTTILDSRFEQVYPMSNAPADYQWERRQVAGTTEFQAIA